MWNSIMTLFHLRYLACQKQKQTDRNSETWLHLSAKCTMPLHRVLCCGVVVLGIFTHFAPQMPNSDQYWWNMINKCLLGKIICDQLSTKPSCSCNVLNVLYKAKNFKLKNCNYSKNPFAWVIYSQLTPLFFKLDSLITYN